MHFTTDIYRVFQLKNSHYCFLHYLLGKWSNLYKNFSKCSWVNSDYSYMKIIEPRINILWYQWHSSDVMYCLFCNSGITVEDIYLPLPTQRTLKVLHLAKRKSHRLTAAKCMTYIIIIFDLLYRNVEHDLWLKFMLVCCRYPLPGCYWILPVLTTFFLKGFSPLTFCPFSGNILYKRVAPKSLLSRNF